MFMTKEPEFYIDPESVWGRMPASKPIAKDIQTIQELNRYPFVEIGHCWRCGEYYKLTQLRLPPAS